MGGSEGGLERLNSQLIPSQAPGSGQGAAYKWLDSEVEAGSSYYYRLEDVAVDGTTSLHGPISATANVPTAVSLQKFQSHEESSAVTSYVSTSLALIMAMLGMIGQECKACLACTVCCPPKKGRLLLPKALRLAKQALYSFQKP